MNIAAERILAHQSKDQGGIRSVIHEGGNYGEYD